MIGLRQPLRAFPLLVAAALLAMPGALEAQLKFPTRPIRIVVPFSPGGGTDTVARIISQKMGESWGQAMVIENRTGAGGTIGTALVAKATPDGHTLLVSSSAFAINAAMDRDLPYDPLKDFSGVTRIGYSKSMLVVTPTIGVRIAQGLHRVRAGAAGQDLLQFRRGRQLDAPQRGTVQARRRHQAGARRVQGLGRCYARSRGGSLPLCRHRPDLHAAPTSGTAN